MIRLADEFVDALPPQAEAPPADLGEALQTAVEFARAGFPRIAVTETDFVRYLATHLDRERGLIKNLLSSTIAEAYLVCGLLAGDNAARDYFADDMSFSLRATVGAIVGANRCDALYNLVCSRILGGGGAQAKIADFSGRDPLLLWLRAAGARQVVRVLRMQGQTEPSTSTLWLALCPSMTPEQLAVRQQTDGAIRAALDVALAALSDTPRTALRQHLVDDAGTDALAQAHNVHRVTITSWLAGARSLLWRHLEQQLHTEFFVDEENVISLLDQLYCALDIDIEQAFLSSSGPIERRARGV